MSLMVVLSCPAFLPSLPLTFAKRPGALRGGTVPAEQLPAPVTEPAQAPVESDGEVLPAQAKSVRDLLVRQVVVVPGPEELLAVGIEFTQAVPHARDQLSFGKPVFRGGVL